MTKPKLTNQELTQLLRDFIRAEIDLRISALNFGDTPHTTLKHKAHADKLFAQIAGIGEGE